MDNNLVKKIRETIESTEKVSKDDDTLKEIYKSLAAKMSDEDVKEICETLGIDIEEMLKETIKIEEAFGECQEKIFGVKEKKQDKDRISKIEGEFKGGEDYTKLLKEFAKAHSTKYMSEGMSIYSLDVEPCSKACKKRDECGLRFLVDKECVWIVLYKKMEDKNFICEVIYSIAMYMEDSEKQMEDKFSF